MGRGMAGNKVARRCRATERPGSVPQRARGTESGFISLRLRLRSGPRQRGAALRAGRLTAGLKSPALLPEARVARLLGQANIRVEWGIPRRQARSRSSKSAWNRIGRNESIRLRLRSDLPPHGRRPVRGDPGPSAERHGARASRIRGAEAPSSTGPCAARLVGSIRHRA
jgi:hypothetical protein